ncbi:SgcJ/EcaC family oxidoreductase [Methanolobus sp. WCC4]|uniref:YybH family protein n=1 Tax=Methanolobus sp. WCC4 TaxID=3125784 RepID=UPI0030FAAC63
MEEQHPIESLINKADAAIGQGYLDTLIDIYADDAVLVIQPGMNAVGKEQIRKAFEAIAAHFEHTLEVEQAGMEILETGDVALVLCNTIVSAKEHPCQERKATYVFKKNANDEWLCAIDNSYGHDLLDV